MTLSALSYNDLPLVLARLQTLGELHAPLRGSDGAVRFGPLPPGAQPDLTAQRSLLPPKKYLLAPSETILTYHPATGYQAPPQPETPLILLGLHPCDLAAIAYLDRLFMAADSPDPLYTARRERLILIGASCTPDQYCSCHQMPSPLPATCDLFLYQQADRLLLRFEGPKGVLLQEALQDLLQSTPAQQPPASTRDHFGSASVATSHEELDPNLPDWQQLADHCLGCGACSICCPTCSCFEVLEFGGLDGCSAERLRRWDNCLFKSHSEVAGGHSFQKDRAQRFRYRYRHKYRGYGQLRGLPTCVGCGRCRVQCPTGLDLRPLAERLERSTP
jgi:sulfhydrogenase subunit beta (sulfur reductase)